MEKAKIWPPATPKPRKRSYYKSAQVITSWTPTPVQKLVTIRPGVSSPRMRDFAHQKRVSFLVFFEFLQLATAKGPGRILTQNTPKHAVPLKDCLFGVANIKSNI